MALVAVYIAALVSVIASLVWVAADRAWARISVRRWDDGVDL